MKIGAHMSIAKGFAQAIKDSVQELDCRSMQIFLKSPRGGKIKPLQPAEIEAYQQSYEDHNFEFVVGHSSYLLNLAKPLDFADNWQMDSLLDDFQKLSNLKGKGLVYHVGKYLKTTYEEAESHLVENLKILLDKASSHKVPLLLENCAGQGTEMGTSFEQVAAVLNKVEAGDMLGVCIDSCHAHSAGYDLSTPENVQKFFDQIQNTITLQKVVCFHLNDSKTPFASRKDRHETLGKGSIGEGGLAAFATLATKHNIPLILETPLINDSHLHDIKILKSWLQIK